MDNLTQVLDPIQMAPARRRGGIRTVVSLIALVALLGAAVVVAHDAGTPSVRDSSQVVAPVTDNTGGEGAPAALRAQFGFDFRSLICNILNSLIGVFGGFFGGIFNSLLAAFGCISPHPHTPPHHP